jgi:hypothetical protein
MERSGDSISSDEVAVDMRPMPLLRRSLPGSATPVPANDGGRRPDRRAPVGRPSPRAPREFGRSILRGDVESISLATLLTILEMERRSGTLVVERLRTVGRICVREGRIIRAQVDGRLSAACTVGPEAIYELLGWPHGQFDLWQAPVDGPDEVGQTTTFLLMEAARRSDEQSASAPAASEAL